jgi:preprotein translocase subunit SecY
MKGAGPGVAPGPHADGNRRQRKDLATMASAAEQLAANLNLGVLAKATELKKRIWFTLGALLVYRIGTYVPVPGVDASVMAEMLRQHGGGILGMFDMFTGGALGRMTVFALNIMPYISASIIIQLMASAVPTLEALKKEGESGRKKLNQYTRYLTVLIAVFQAWAIAVGLESIRGSFGPAVQDPGMFFRFSCVVTLVGGTMFLMWLGEQITARGIGNGISLIIFAGIVANLPSALVATLELGRTGALSTVFIILFLAMALGVITLVVFVERAQRRIPVQYPKRQVGNRMFGGENTHLPLKLNTSGVIPPIFASSLLLLPATVAGFSSDAGDGGWLSVISNALAHGQPLYMALYAALIIFFAFFYTAIVFNPAETADNLKKYGGFVPGIRPGQNTADYFDRVLTRLTAVGALYLCVVCLLPEILISRYGVPFYFGGTSLLIIVSVTMDTVAQVQSHLFAHQYEGLIRKARLGGRGAPRVR